MPIDLQLFGAFRDFDPTARIALDVPDDATIAEVRSAFDAYAQAHWSNWRPALLRASVFASEQRVLRDAEPVPADGRLAVLPPVSGG